MRAYHFDHVHLRSRDPDAMGSWFETLFGAVVSRGIYPPGTLYPGQMRVCTKGNVPLELSAAGSSGALA